MVEAPFVTLGDLVLGDTDPTTGARFTLRGIGGWDGVAPEPALSRRQRGHGAWTGRFYRNPRHIVVSGLIKTDSPAMLEDARDRLTAAAPIDDTVFTVHGALRDRWATVRREDAVLVRQLSPTIAEYSVQLVAADPRKFGAVLSRSTTLPTTAGGLSVPFTVPFVVDAVTSNGQVSLFNPGNVAGPVRLRIDAPATAPVVTHVSAATAPRALVFASSLVLGAGQWVDVDMEARTVLENGQASRNGWITQRGWSSFEPGWNTWSLSAGAFHAETTLTVTAVEAWD